MTSPTVLSNPRIQNIIDQYKALGWEDVHPLDMGGRLPKIVAWKDTALSIHLELSYGAEMAVEVSFVNIFVLGINGAVGGFWFQGHHLTPGEARAIVNIVTGKATMREIEEEAEAGNPTEEVSE